MSGIERGVVYFKKLQFEINNEKLSLRRVNSNEIRGHPGGNKYVSERSGGERYLSQSYEDGIKK